jgi:hypothetical protein
MTIYLIFLGIIVVLLVAAVAFLIKGVFSLSTKIDAIVNVLSNQPEPTPVKRESNIEDDVAAGLVKGLQQMRTDDERHLKLLAMARKLQRQPTPIMNQNSAADDRFDTGGDLIPANLTREELDVLKEFYGNQP